MPRLDHQGRSLALFLAAAVLAAACGTSTTSPSIGAPAASAGTGDGIALAHTAPAGATAPVDDATWSLVQRLTTPAYTADTTAAFQEALARSGIAVVADANAIGDPAAAVPETPLSGPASPFELLDFQAHALAVGAWAGAGWTGAELDGVVPLPDGLTDMATTSDLLAGYVATADTPGGSLSRALMTGQDLLHPATARFPAVVLVLFVSDLATDGGRVARPAASPSAQAGLTRLLANAPAGSPSVRLALAVDSVCSDTAKWIDSMIGSLFDALKVATPDNVPGAIVASIWNWLVDVAHMLVNKLIVSVTSAVLGTIRSIAASIAVVAEQVASVLPYAVTVTAAGPTGKSTIKLGSNPVPGSFTAVVSAGDLPEMPAVLTDCAKTAQIDLPDFNAKNVPLTWGPLEALADPLLAPIDSATPNGVTDATGKATWGFLTSRDPGDPNGEDEGQLDHMPVAVHRPELDRARDKLTSALLGFIPDLVRPFVTALFAPYLDGLQSRLNTLLDARGVGTVALQYHNKVPPSPVPSGAVGSASPGSCAVTLPAGTYQGTLKSDSTTIVPPGQIDLGESGGTNDHGTGPVTITVAADGTLGGSFQLDIASHQVFQGLAKGTTDTTMHEVGAGVNGTLCNLILTFASSTITGCQATGHGTCGGVGTTISLAGLVPPLPLGAPKSVAGGVMTWSISSEDGFDAGFGGLSAEVQTTITVTLQTH